ncbi:MAG: GtrA family protein [Acidobacteria bacterium]|nr:GtrA family protein [Acidobacteriota bacterium]
MSKFVFVGVLNTVVGYGLFVLLVLLDIHYLVASLVAQGIAVTHSYLWNKYFTFGKVAGGVRELVRFIGVYTAQYVLTLSLLIVLVEYGGVRPIMAQGVILGVTTVFAFVAHKYWTFRAVV